MVGKRGFAASVLLLFFVEGAAAAISIQYSVVPVGGNVYRYVYSITNTGGSPTVQLFDILFDTALYQESSLQIVTQPPLSTQWSQQILHSVPPVIPAAYDALTLVGGVPAGTTVSGFSVQFVWLGSGTPGTQPFEVYDPLTFNLLVSGTTTPGPAAVIPAASTLSFALLAVSMAVVAGRQMRLRAAEVNRSRALERW